MTTQSSSAPTNTPWLWAVQLGAWLRQRTGESMTSTLCGCPLAPVPAPTRTRTRFSDGPPPGITGGAQCPILRASALPGVAVGSQYHRRLTFTHRDVYQAYHWFKQLKPANTRTIPSQPAERQEHLHVLQRFPWGDAPPLAQARHKRGG